MSTPPIPRLLLQQCSASADPTFILDSDGVIADSNAAAKAYAEVPVQGKRLEEIVVECDDRLFLKALLQAYQGRASDQEYTCLRSSSYRVMHFEPYLPPGTLSVSWVVVRLGR